MSATLAPPPIWTTGSTAVFRTGTWRSTLAQHVQAPSPCHAACPVGGEIASWIGQARAGDFHGAWLTLTDHNPFPAVAGRICHHPCETSCNRAGHDEALAICKLERFVGDRAIDEGWSFAPPAAQRRERIAVVGGGPSGLAAAFQLRRRGYAVTLFESQPELGGLMRHGIPAYRLARRVLDAEIARIVALGIDVRCRQPLRGADDLASLRAGHDAVYLALGAQRPKRLQQLQSDRPWVIDGAEYLARSSRGDPPAFGPRLVVVGGGSAAFDAARSARRCGHEVTILALEVRDALPAQPEEVAEAQEEGIAIVDGSMLRGVIEGGGPGLRLDCVRVRFEAGSQRGRFTVTPLPGGEFVLHADALVSSIGQDPDLRALTPALAHDSGLLQIDARGATSQHGVWAGGDLASKARFVTEAIGMGSRAALDIDRRLRRGSGAGDAPAGVGATVPLAAINLHYHPTQPRAVEQRLPVGERLSLACEVQLGLGAEEALDEARRCFSCGLCTHCDNCITYCPDLAVEAAPGGYRVLADYCKGCGLCVRECPTGSMTMHEELR